MSKDQVIEIEKFLTEARYQFAETIAVDQKKNSLSIKVVDGPQAGKMYKVDGTHMVFGAEEKPEKNILAGVYGVTQYKYHRISCLPPEH